MVEDDETDSDTSSDEYGEDPSMDVYNNMDEHEVAEHLYFQYRQARRHWRRCTGKLVRRFRRVVKFQKRYRKGKRQRLLLDTKRHVDLPKRERQRT